MWMGPPLKRKLVATLIVSEIPPNDVFRLFRVLAQSQSLMLAWPQSAELSKTFLLENQQCYTSLRGLIKVAL